MAPKRRRESDESAAGGAKKPRKDRDTPGDDDDDEEMYDVPPASEGLDVADDTLASGTAEGKPDDKTEIPRIDLGELDYVDLPFDLVYDNNGRIHPPYKDQTASPTVAVPIGPIPVPKPKPKPKTGGKFKEKFLGIKTLHGDWIGVPGKLGSGGQGYVKDSRLSSTS